MKYFSENIIFKAIAAVSTIFKCSAFTLRSIDVDIMKSKTKLIFTITFTLFFICYVNPLSANPEKWSNTLKQIVGNLPTICLSVFDHFMNLTLKGLIYTN